ncbi:PREDICTED: destrin-like [Nanorana parkeri]|uniref:destrin-like n=1 Tax=Nanorana parkeri TaxID=125878 RepID=UPI0008544AE3|nr:PREDICTED: destrin-like [Nanorana parkeri]
MASGVQVDDSVTLLFQDMKLKKCGKKAVFFGFSSDEKYIVVQEGKEILSDDCANFFPRLKALFPENKCCYALLDIHYVTGESKKQDLIFVMWAPEDAPIKEKLLFASSKPYLKQAFSGVNKQWELHSQDDLTVDQLAQKLTSGKIKSLEGHHL